MGEPLIFILCLISLLLSVISLYVSLRVAKNLQTTHKNVETLHQALLAVLQPQAHGGQYIIHYIDDEYYEEENFNKLKTLINQFHTSTNPDISYLSGKAKNFLAKHIVSRDKTNSSTVRDISSKDLKNSPKLKVDHTNS